MARRVFEEKGCASCHERLRRETGAPDLAAARNGIRPITIAASLFRHGPAMLEQDGETECQLAAVYCCGNGGCDCIFE